LPRPLTCSPEEFRRESTAFSSKKPDEALNPAGTRIQRAGSRAPKTSTTPEDAASLKQQAMAQQALLAGFVASGQLAASYWHCRRMRDQRICQTSA